MFVRKWQVICILLTLVILVKNSTAGLVITNDTKNSTNIANTTAAAKASGGGYPIHKVSTAVRGWLVPINYLRLHWVDWTRQSKWYEDITTNGHDWLTLESTSPNWAAGYYYEFSSLYGDGGLSPIFWWDGWVNGIFCNDLHFYIKHAFIYVCSPKIEVIWGRDCSYPL